MSRFKAVQTRVVIVLGILIIALLVGCAVRKEIWGDPKSGLNLTYRMGENEILKYRTSSQENQKLEMMGQTMETKVKASNEFSVLSKGLTEQNFLLGITVDDMKIEVTGGMTGEITPELGAIIGKSFDMTLSPMGEEGGFSGIEKLQYQVGPSKRGIKSSFRDIFPNLANKPVKIGDTWTNKEDFTEKEGSVDIHIIAETVNTLQGLETLDGLECVKIEGKITGTFDGKGEQMGSQFTLAGTLKGTSTWYFAYKKGILVSIKSASTSEGKVEVRAQGMTIPVTTESGSEVNLIK